jgi:DNA-binding NarL/FixJ family response regulator
MAAVAGWTLLRQGAPASDVVPLALEALQDDVLLDFDDGFLAPGAFTALVLADREEGFAAVERLAAHAHRRGSLFADLGVKLWGGLAQLARGDLPAAEAALRANLDDLARYARPHATDAFPVAFLARTLLERGDVAGARAVLDAHEPSRTVVTRRLWLGALSAVLVAERRPEDALAAVEELRGLLGPLDAPAWDSWRPQRALALRALGRTAEALADAEDELRLARRFGAPSVVGRSLRLLGTLREDASVLEEAVDVLEESSARLELARALAALGGVLRRSGEPTRAREPLRRALDMAAACGADGLVRDVRAELHASGLRPRSTALGGVGALTASERRVADLAAAGRTNREIAQTLYVTPKTVEVHLSSAYRKLGIESRRGLAGALGAAA